MLRICNGEKTNLLLRGEHSQRVMSKIVDHDFVALNSLDVDDGIENTNFPHFDGHDNSGDILSLKANPFKITRLKR